MAKATKVKKSKQTVAGKHLRSGKRTGTAKPKTSPSIKRGGSRSPKIKSSLRSVKGTPLRRPTQAARRTAVRANLSVKIFDLKGKSIGTATLPRQTFGQKPNSNLLAQAVRVYMARHIPHTAHTKTRGEVTGGGAKPWKQKGTGRARAGSRRSPLWVGGGIVFGPRAQARELILPKKMRRQALIHALSDKAKDGNIKIISSIEKIQPKTKLIANLLAKLSIRNQHTLLVISQKNQNVKLATRNIPKFNLDLVPNLNAYEVLRNQNLLISKEAIAKFK